MIKKYGSRLIILLICMHALSSFAQKEDIKNTFITTEIKPDGHLTEWNDSLRYYHSEAKLAYSIGNDTNNLYIAIKTSDPQAIKRLLSFGISLSINKESKKKAGPTVTFPIIDKAAVRTIMQNANQRSDFNKLNQQIIAKTNGIYVTNFKTILDGTISLTNEYGISAGATIDDKNVFRCELTVPLQQLEMDLQNPNPFYCHIKLNGAQRTELYQSPPMRNSGRYGYGYPDYGDRNVYKRTISESVDFWIKTSLAKQ